MNTRKFREKMISHNAILSEFHQTILNAFGVGFFVLYLRRRYNIMNIIYVCMFAPLCV